MAKVNLILCDSSIKDRNGNDKIVAWICDLTGSECLTILIYVRLSHLVNRFS